MSGTLSQFIEDEINDLIGELEKSISAGTANYRLARMVLVASHDEITQRHMAEVENPLVRITNHVMGRVFELAVAELDLRHSDAELARRLEK